VTRSVERPPRSPLPPGWAGSRNSVCSYGSLTDRSVVSFAVGDKVFYPHHGATVIERVETVEAFGAAREYLVLRFDDIDLTLRVPSEEAASVGLREVICGVEVDDVFAVLRRRDVRMPSNWSRRFKNHTEMLRSGDVYQLAEVVRNLTRRKADKALSAGEQRMLERARRVLISELSLSLTEDAERVSALLDAALV
jgi:CarD family transcriptional regulator